MKYILSDLQGRQGLEVFENLEDAIAVAKEKSRDGKTYLVYNKSTENFIAHRQSLLVVQSGEVIRK